jgi:pimeloyl-ACP methyl ester carboxylesterase
MWFSFLSMFFHRFGESSAPTIILLHGIPGSAASWNGVAKRLAPDHDVVVPDLLGFGKSPRPEEIHAETQAVELDAALDRAGIEHAAVVGHDFGGPVALSLYRRHPKLFASLALMATNTFPDTPIPFPLSAVNLPIVGDLAARALFSKPALKQMFRRYGGTHLGDAVSVRRIFTQSLRNLDELYRDYPAILATVEVPALVVWGDSDPFFPLAQGERTAALLPDAEIRVLVGAGHFLPEQQPVEIADALRALHARETNNAAGSL